MKILQIGAIGLPVRPDLKYGGTERVISYLDGVYTELGHESLVAAPGDSIVEGTLVKTIPKSLWSINGNPIKRQIAKSNKLTAQHYKTSIDLLLNDRSIDVVHDHPGAGVITTDYFKRVMHNIRTPILQTLHGTFSKGHQHLYQRWRDIAEKKERIFFNAISNSQKIEFKQFGIKIEEVIYHGIHTDKFTLNDSKEDYLFSIGRISPEKGQHIAIEIAKKTGRPLVIAGEVHSVNEAYWEEMIKPNIDGDQIKFVGPKTDEEKIPLYQKAVAFLMPIQWSEPFGLVMIEAMACGTPVIAYSRGSVPEVVKDGETGFVIQETGDKEEDLEAMVRAVNNIGSISPLACRKHVEENFSIETEAENYLNLYKRIIENGR